MEAKQIDTTNKQDEEEKKEVTGYTLPMKRSKTGEGDDYEAVVKSVPLDPVKEEKEKVMCRGFKKKKLAMIVGYNGSEF
jgi:hypothetical protein